MTNPEPPDTKAKILDAAESLFSEHGFAETSMRAITSTADVNLAAAHYHFGSKEAVLGAVLERRLEPINRKRIDEVRRVLEAGGGDPPEVEQVLHAFFGPAFETIERMGEAGARFVRLAGRMHADSNETVRALFVDQFRDVVPPFVEAFRRALPQHDDDVIGWKVHFVIGAMAHTLAWTRDVGGPSAVGLPGPPADPAAVQEALVSFCAAGLRAPVTTRSMEDVR